MAESEGEWEWEESDEEEKVEFKAEVREEKPDIKIQGSLITIDRTKVDWSDDEECESDEPSIPPPPPPPPPTSNIPPPPPPPASKSLGKSEKLELLKKRPTKRPDWNDLMQEIEKYKCGKSDLLNKTVTNDRSQPILSKTKAEGMFVYESEKSKKDVDILKSIQKGAKLRHVRTNDRSKPNLKGIKQFRRQLTKEEKLNAEMGAMAEEVLDDNIDDSDVNKLKDDLESTKQLLELEVRSKQLLDKTNKKLQNEIDQLRADFERMKNEGVYTALPEAKSRKNSVKERRKVSIARSISENPSEIDNELTEEQGEVVEQMNDEIEELKEEADQARRLAEEWEIKYKEMHRQMEDLETGPRNDNILDQTSSEQNKTKSEGTEENWIQKRELQQLQTKIRNIRDKKEFLERERNFLNERLENLKQSIQHEVDSRKMLKKEVREMNAAFKAEMAEMAAEEQLQKEMEECYVSDEEELVTNVYTTTTNNKEEEDEEVEDFLDLDEEEEEGLEEILRNAESSLDAGSDEGAALFFLQDTEEVVGTSSDNYIFPTTLDTQQDSQPPDLFDQERDALTDTLDKQTDKIQLMRKSNFLLKSKIDILSDILQVQKEKHQDLKQELNRMLVDIQ